MWNCVPAGAAHNPVSSTSFVTPMQKCQCDGDNYFGMPEIDFLLAYNGYPVNYAYELHPEFYELFPSVSI